MRIRNIDRSFDEVVPTKYLLAPELETIEKMNWRSVSQGEFLLAELHPSLDLVGIIVDPGIANEIVNAIHLHLDLMAYRDLSGHDPITKLTVILWDSGVR